MEFFGLWLLFSAVLGFMASSWGRSGFGWFLIGLILSPLLGLVILLIAGKAGVQMSASPGRQAAPGDAPRVRCEQCHELIYAQAKVCRFCGAERTPAVAVAGVTRQESVDSAEDFGYVAAKGAKKPGVWVVVFIAALAIYALVTQT